MNKTRIHNQAALAGILGLAAVVSGCATLYEGKYAFRDGWRKAEVVQIASAAELERPEFYTCVRRTPAQQRADQKYVVVKWLRMGKKASHAQPLPPGQQLAPGDAVYVNMDTCEGQIVKRAA